jgi:hypothetical protein
MGRLFACGRVALGSIGIASSLGVQVCAAGFGCKEKLFTALPFVLVPFSTLLFVCW